MEKQRETKYRIKYPEQFDAVIIVMRNVVRSSVHDAIEAIINVEHRHIQRLVQNCYSALNGELR